MVNSKNLKLRERCINLAGRFYLCKKSRNHTRKPGITVINYHRISGSTFSKHLAYLSSHYQLLSPEFFLEWLDDEQTIDRPSLVFTFDDAYLSFYEAIYPILKENNLSVFMFVPTRFIGTSDYFWEDELEIALRKAGPSSIAINRRRFYLYSRLYRTDWYDQVLRHLRFLDGESRDKTKNDLLAQINVNITDSDMNGYQFVNWPQILEMDKSGLVAFGSHTVSHENLSSLSDETVRFELQESKRTLENHLEKRVQAFAYPYGGRESFNPRIASQIKEAGYVCAFTTMQGRVEEKRSNKFRLKRTMLFDYQNEGTVALKLDTYTKRRFGEAFPF